ncbi:hypothetical protein RS130_17865 [Paraglaciecola aquimarina]|uniref:Uncharacterized protein n=1 Tax=Paraglaciecola aquimarina TaxID=1235557 RepID=A0ABU3SZS0_9ALTE|nr:hypothetical protein [Paraglaciecola aquimarina]MDU0355514.1 hypothetical protein [Paraglaciecola aquimarina]
MHSENLVFSLNDTSYPELRLFNGTAISISRKYTVKMTVSQHNFMAKQTTSPFIPINFLNTPY